MNSLTRAFDEIRKITHKQVIEKREGTSTQQTARAQEDSVVEKLVARDFRELPADGPGALSKEIIGLISQGNRVRLSNKLPPGNWFMREPDGTQKPTDIFIQYNGGLFWIECKTGDDKITANDSLPVSHSIYIITDKKTNETCFRFGSEMVDEEVRQQLEKWHKEDRKRWDVRKKEILSWKENAEHQWFNIPRPKFQQKGGRDVTNWVLRIDRDDAEQRVRAHIDEESGTLEPDVRRYISTEKYEKGETILHHEYGKGLVIEITKSLHVSFDCGKKRLAHNREIVIDPYNRFAV